MTAGAGAIGAVAAAAALVGVLLLASGRLPRTWDVILVEIESPLTDVPEASPRLDRLAAAGAVLPNADAAELERLGDRLQSAGWNALHPEAGPSLEGTTDLALEAALDPASRAPRLLVVRYRPASAGELNTQLGRLIDGLAGGLVPSHTLFVVVDRERRRVLVSGPPAAASVTGPDVVTAVDDLLRLR